MVKEVTFRQARAAIPAINCLMEPDGAFGHLSDVLHLRVSLLCHEISAAERKLGAAMGPRKMSYALRDEAGKLVHPTNEAGEPDRSQIVIDPERLVEYEAAMQAMLDETTSFDVKEIRASQLRNGDGKIPAGWWTTEGANGDRAKHPLGPAALLMGLAAFIVMDLDE